jgi:uncharacterized protein
LKLKNEFVVAAPVERTWPALLDVPRLARALPGASIDTEPADGAYRGTMKVKFGAVTAEYAGTAMLQDVDEDDRVASFRVEARERHGQGGAAATITSRLRPEDGRTHVSVETDLEVTGRQAQLGRGIMEDVAASVLKRFAERLESELAGGPADGQQAPAVSEETLDLGSAVLGPLRERALVFAAGLLIGLVAGRLIARR